MKVIGTAGHVDHGKSRLVMALTGINPDRLQEERERQMTIDLGFAWLTLPGGEDVGIIDVPGHRDFIENMLAGVGGIDAALFVIAADEGVMPQTREHLAILDLLEVERAVVALTKIDLVQDEDWINLVREDVVELLEPTRLRQAPIVPVSVVASRGLEELVAALEEVLQDSPTRRNFARPRLAIDRAFTISGFGTVVTGTLLDGTLRIGQEVELLPSGYQARIRGLQTHKSKIDAAVPGSRVAANITGVEVRQIERGDVLVSPGTYQTTRLIDVRFRLLADAASPLKHNMQVKLFLGSAQRLARTRVLGRTKIDPGEEGWLQLVLEKPLVAARGDHYILRRPSPGATLGGGQVADPFPVGRHKRKDEIVVHRLEQLLRGTAGDILAQSLDALGPTTLGAAIDHARLEDVDRDDAIQELLQSDSLVVFSEQDLVPDTIVASRSVWEGMIHRFDQILGAFHQSNPLKMGMPREELKSRMEMTSKIFNVVLEKAIKAGHLIAAGDRVRRPEFEVTLEQDQKARLDQLHQRFDQAPFSPPSVKESMESLGEELFTYALESGEYVQVSADVLFRRPDYDHMLKEIRRMLEDGGALTVAQVRDRFETSRKYALALMEHLDAIGITVREGDERRLA